MKRFYFILTLALAGMLCTHAQSVGIGTTIPDNSAALDISSSNKGLLIPRINLAVSMAAPATGLMVFNTNAGFGSGTGLYINMGTAAAPQWMQLVPSGSGNFVRNQATQQVNTNFNISGSGIVGNGLAVSGSSVNPLTVESLNPYNAGIRLTNSTSPYADWVMRTAGNSLSNPGTFSLFNFFTGATGLTVAKDGSVGIGKPDAPTAKLDVAGDIKASGNFLIDVKYRRFEYSLGGNSRAVYIVDCPENYQVISGGGGHRDYNGAAPDIRIDYNGPNPASPSSSWRLIVTNTSSQSRAIITYCNCAKIR